MKIALVYDRINKFGGAERVLTALHQIWPEAPVFTSVYDPEGAPWADGWDIRTSWLQKFPWARKNHESFGWLMPLVFESFDLSGFDTVISLTSEAAKGVITKPGQLHVCYLLTPTRYLWSHGQEYLDQIPGLIKPLAISVQSKLREWDFIAAQRPDYIISISHLVRKRCKKYYHRSSEVIYPPVELARSAERVADSASHPPPAIRHAPLYYLVVSRLVPYKRIDLAIEACNKFKVNLVIVGSGTDETRLKEMAGQTVKFVGNLTDAELVEYYRGAEALLMPQEEDFGLTAIEALSVGTPVISYQFSGAAEIIEDGKTGVVFKQQTIDSLVDAIKRFASMEVKVNFQTNFAKLIENKFSQDKFKETFLKKIKDLWQRN